MIPPAPTSSSTDRAPRRRSSIARWGAWSAVTLAAFLLLLLVDRPIYRAATVPWTEATRWHQALKALGTIWPWLGVALALFVVGAWRARGRIAPERRTVMARAADGAILLASSPVIAGAVAEVLKITIRRERPELHDGAHVFRPWSVRPLHGGGLDLPSSHAAVALGGAAALCILAPRLAPLWLALGVGCAITRALEGAHFTSALLLGGAIGVASAAGVRRFLRRARL